MRCAAERPLFIKFSYRPQRTKLHILYIAGAKTKLHGVSVGCGCVCRRVCDTERAHAGAGARCCVRHPLIMHTQSLRLCKSWECMRARVRARCAWMPYQCGDDLSTPPGGRGGCPNTYIRLAARTHTRTLSRCLTVVGSWDKLRARTHTHFIEEADAFGSLPGRKRSRGKGGSESA